MTQAEFSKGWKLLILQPWGWRYRSLTAEGKPSEESRTQLEFYYQKLQWGHRDAWMKVSDLFAQGDEWPSVADMRRALQSMQNQFVGGITDAHPQRYEPMPEGFMERIVNIGKPMPGA